MKWQTVKHRAKSRTLQLRFGREEEVEFVERARPIFAEEAGECAVGEEFASGLARGAIVGFVAGITDALDFGATAWAGKFVSAMDCHAFAKGGYFLGELAGGFGAEAIGPLPEAGAYGFEEALDFGDGEFLRERERRELGFPEDFVGVGIADAAEEAGISEGALESVVGREERGGELLWSGGKNFEAAWIERAEAVFAEDYMERGTLLRAGFGPEERAVGKVEGG
jgi:hypothetical protein